MSGRMDEREFFARRYEGIDPDALWAAVKRALATMDLKEADDDQKTAHFSTGVSLTSWGQSMLAMISGNSAEGSTLVVRGRPKGSLLTTKAGEDLHAHAVERRILGAVDTELSNAGKV